MAPETVKPVPATVAALTVTAAVPVEDRVSVCVVAVFTFTLPKDKLDELTLSVGTAAPSDRAKVFGHAVGAGGQGRGLRGADRRDGRRKACGGRACRHGHRGRHGDRRVVAGQAHGEPACGCRGVQRHGAAIGSRLL